MVLAPIDCLADVSRRKPALNSDTRYAAKLTPCVAPSVERLEIAPPTTTSAPFIAHQTARLVNKLGNYHGNNRVYSIGHGRWLSPDQAASPFFNLFDYVRFRITQAADATGLAIVIEKNNEPAGDPTSSADFCEEWEACDAVIDGKVVKGCCERRRSTGINAATAHPVGCSLICCLLKSPHTTTIRYGKGAQNQSEPSPVGTDRKPGATPSGGGIDKKGVEQPVTGVGTNADGTVGTGSTVTVSGKGSFVRDGDKKGARSGTREIARVLAHELGHSCHAAQGNWQIESMADAGRFKCGQNGNKEGDWGNTEERNTIKEFENPIAKEIGDAEAKKSGKPIDSKKWGPAIGY